MVGGSPNIVSGSGMPMLLAGSPMTASSGIAGGMGLSGASMKGGVKPVYKISGIDEGMCPLKIPSEKQQDLCDLFEVSHTDLVVPYTELMRSFSRVGFTPSLNEFQQLKQYLKIGSEDS